MQYFEVSLGFPQVTFFSPFVDLWIFAGVSFFLLLFISSLSAFNAAYFTIEPSNQNIFKKNNSKFSLKILKMLKEPKNVSFSILIIKVIFIIFYILLSLLFFYNITDSTIRGVFPFLIFILLNTLVILFIGEIIPKVIGIRFPIKTLSLLFYFVSFAIWIIRPFANIFISLLTFAHKKAIPKKRLTLDNLTEVLNQTSSPSKEDKEILKGIVEFSSTEVNDILTPRLEIIALDIKSPFKRALQVILESGYSRIPVYNESIDNIKGILYIKDLLSHIHKSEFKWQVLIRPPYFIPEKKKINKLLQEFQTSKNHMAVVVDEYGGTKGIVCLEDILEEIVGEIRDEFDDEDKTYTRIDDNNFVFSGRTLIHDFYRITKINPEDFEKIRGESDTLAGFIMELKGSIPQRHETLLVKNFLFKIEEADNRSIKKIRFIIKNENE